MAIRNFTDQMGKEVQVPFPPQRMISLVPSQTELLADLGLEDRVVGITRFCVHPAAWKKSKPVIGGTKHFRFDTIDSLQPDLIIGNKEENYREGIEQLSASYPVWMSDVVTLADALDMIQRIGDITSETVQSKKFIQQIVHLFGSIPELPPLRTLYLIWRDPWMGAGSDTFIHEMLLQAGLINALEENMRYPRLTADEIIQLNPDLVLLSSEPFPFRETHIGEIQALCPKSRALCVDGKMFSWYGSRMLRFPAYVRELRTRLH
jgi:ABC-type Fe3+-hydroxamate transport system substrate-binding protein